MLAFFADCFELVSAFFAEFGVYRIFRQASGTLHCLILSESHSDLRAGHPDDLLREVIDSQLVELFWVLFVRAVACPFEYDEL